MIKKYKFDDYLDILQQDFSQYKYIVFLWNSWSGKTSYIEELLKKNTSITKDITVIDEIYNVSDLLKMFLLLFDRKKKFIIASHIWFRYYSVFKLLWKVKEIQTDDNSKKIENYLEYKKLKYSKEVLDKFIKMYGATYTDIDIILEKYDWDNFDIAFTNFIKFNTLDFTTENQWIKIS